MLFGEDSPLIPFEADADCFQLRIQQLGKTLKIRATSAADRDAWSKIVETQCALLRDKTRPPKGAAECSLRTVGVARIRHVKHALSRKKLLSGRVIRNSIEYKIY